MVHTTSKFIKWLKKITLLYPYLNKILEEKKPFQNEYRTKPSNNLKKKSSYDKTSEEQNQG